MISTVGEELNLELTVAGEKKILFAGYNDWKCNDMYPNDFTKRYHAVSYAYDEDALYLSVGLLNTSYREEYCLWVNSENVVVGTWRPNVTYLPAEEDMTWKFTGTFEPSCILLVEKGEPREAEEAVPRGFCIAYSIKVHLFTDEHIYSMIL